MKNRILINYDTSGMCICGDTVSTKEAIYLTIIEAEPGKPYHTIGKMEINRYPSDARPLNVRRRKDGYSMAMMMSCDKDSCSDVIAQEMDLYGAHLIEPTIQALGYNDLYVIKSVFITKRKRGKGYGTYVLSHIEDALRCISNDSNPVIAVVPHAFENPADTDRVIRFFKSNNFKQVHEDSRTLLKY